MSRFKMLPTPMKIVFLVGYLTCVSNAGENLEEKKARESFVRYFTEDAKKHQVMILIDEEDTKETIKQNDFITKISRHVPTMLVSHQHLKNSRKNYIKHIGKNPRDTTLFVSLVTDGLRAGNSLLDPTKEIIANLSNQYTRPKYLIVHLAKNLSWPYKEYLSEHWNHQFLDVTILQVTEKGTSTNKGLFKTNQRFLTRYQFNPYSLIISKEKDWLKSQWFPDKTKNLHKHRVILRNRYWYKLELLVFKFFAESINSTALESLPATEYPGPPSAGLNCLRIGYYHLESQCNWHITIFINFEELVAVVPRLGTYDKVELVSWKLVLGILANVLLVIVLRLVFMLIKFDRDSWQMLDIFAVILGLDFLNVPKRVFERIVACCLLLGCIIYSGYLHTLLTEVELQTIPEQEVKTVEDLTNLNLTMYTNVPYLTHRVNEANAIKINQTLRNRTFSYINGYRHYECLYDLEKHKNVSCQFPLYDLLLIAKDAKKNHLIRNATIVGEALTMIYYTYWGQDGEVLMGAFNKYLLRIRENGLMSKWGHYPSIKKPLFSAEIENTDVDTSGILHRRVLLYLAFGYGLALMVFFCELLLDLSQRKDIMQEILGGLRRIKRALCNMLEKCKRGCMWFFAKLRNGCRPSHFRRGCKFLRSKLRNAWVAVTQFLHRFE